MEITAIIIATIIIYIMLKQISDQVFNVYGELRDIRKALDIDERLDAKDFPDE